MTCGDQFFTFNKFSSVMLYSIFIIILPTVQKSSIFFCQVQLFLKDSWIATLRAAIRTSLRDVGKGWYNLHETNWEVYQRSKLKKFMEMVKFCMQVCSGICLFFY